MTSAVSYTIYGPVAVIQMNSPPVNGLGLELRQSLVHTLSRALATASIGAIVLIGSERAFSGGADVREFGTPLALREPNLRFLTRMIEECAKPVIAAVGGACMGGGFELALACHFRIATPDAAIALPEVRLGIMPGAGGTQRLPRAVGLETALDMIVFGKTIPASRLRGAALFDEIVNGDLCANAVAFADRLLTEHRPLRRVRDRKVEHPSAAAVIAATEAMIDRTLKGQPAPLKCVQAVASTLSLPFEDGLKLEQELCDRLIDTPESKALRHVFAAERAANKVPGLPTETAVRDINQVGIIGAGAVACGIAICCLDAGLSVVVIESDQEKRQQGIDTISGASEASRSNGNTERAQWDRRVAALRMASDRTAIKDCDLIIDPAVQPTDGKRGPIEELSLQAKPGAIIAINGFTADLDRIAPATGTFRNVVGLRFFDPPQQTRVMEIARSDETAPEVVATCLVFAKRINKVAVVCRVSAEPVGDRMRRSYLTAARILVTHGATPLQVNQALMDFGMSWEPFRAEDLAGSPSFRQAASHARRPDERAIVERCVCALVNEGSRILEEGIITRSSDIDIISIHVCGFPAYRGGPMHYANEEGLERIAAAITGFAADSTVQDPHRPVSPLLTRLAATRGKFA